MTKIKVLIVDDEPRAHAILENYIARTPELELAGNCYNAIEAQDFLKTNPVHLVFLDITMPEVDGFGFLKMLEKQPLVIFTTAHSEFALESYDYNAVDYLKKPIPFERFAKAINKLTEWVEKGISFEPLKDILDLKIDGSIRSVPFDHILYVQSLGNYVKIVTEGKVLVTQITTSELEESLPRSQFLRIHKSYIVNKSKIDKMMDDELVIKGNTLPIGKTFKKYVKELLAFRH